MIAMLTLKISMVNIIFMLVLVGEFIGD